MAMWDSMIEWYQWYYKSPQCNRSWLGWDGWVVTPDVNQSQEQSDE